MIGKYSFALLLSCVVGWPVTARPQSVADTVEFHAVVEEGSLGAIEMPTQSPGKTFYLQREVLLSSRDIRSAIAQSTRTGCANVLIAFTDEGAKKLATITGAYRGRQLAIVIHGIVIFAPMIREKISGGQAVIDSGFSLEEVQRVARDIVSAQ